MINIHISGQENGSVLYKTVNEELFMDPEAVGTPGSRRESLSTATTAVAAAEGGRGSPWSQRSSEGGGGRANRVMSDGDVAAADHDSDCKRNL